MNGGFGIAAVDAALDDYFGLLFEPAAMPETAAEDASPANLECLLIEAGGVALALRRAEVTAACAWPPEGAVEAGDGVRIDGYCTYAGARVALVDIARVILPPARWADLADTLAQRASEVLLVGGGRWGLVSETPARPLALDNDAVRWRGEAAGTRPWLAGMVAEPQCALIDTAALITTLAEARR